MKQRFTKLLAAFALLVGLTIPMGVWGESISMTMTEYVTSHGCTVSAGTNVTCYTTLSLDNYITMSTTGQPNCGSFWGTTTNDWRLYQNKGGNVIITPSNGVVLNSVNLTFSVSNNGTLLNGSTALDSGEPVEVSGNTVTFTVGNSGNATNGQVRITAVEVVYTLASGVSTTTTITAPQNFNNDLHVGTTAGTLTASVTETNGGTAVSGAAVVWASTDTNVATVDQNGAVTLVAVGTTNITVTYAGNTTYAPSTGTYQLNVVDNTPSTGTDVTFTAGTDTGNNSMTKSNVTISSTNAVFTYNPYRIYTNAVTTISVPAGYTITKVVINGASGYDMSKFTVNVGDYSVNNNVGTWTGNTSSVEFTNTHTAQLRVTSFVVTIESTGSTPAISVSPSTLNTFSYLSTSTDPSAAQQITVSGANLTAGITVSVGANSAFEMCTTENGDYSNSDITLPQTNGAVAATSIYVRMKANQTGNPTGTLSLTSAGATEVSIALNGSVVTPMTVAEAIAAIAEASGNTVDDAYVSGIVCQIDGYDSSHNSITYWISDDGTTTTKLEVYSGKGLNGANFTSVDDLTVGDEVVVFGDLKMYGEIYEFNYNNYLVSWVHNVIPVISADNVNLLYTATTGAINYSIQNGEGIVSAELTEGDWLVLGEVTANTVPFTCSANTGEERTASIKLSFDGANDKIVTVTQAAYEAPNVTWDLSIASYDEITDSDIVTWSSEYATMTNSSKSGGTSASNYLGGDSNNRTSSRFYSGNTLTISPAAGYAITSVVFTATSVNYANAFAGSEWTNATASASASGTTVTVTPTDGTADIVATISGTCGFSGVTVYYLNAYTLTIPAFNSQNGGYRLISSPVATATNPTNPGDVTKMLTPKDGDNNTYDLYRFDQAEELEWRNYRNTDGGGFSLEVGKGYLYGNLSDVELVFTGTAITSGTQNVTLDYTEGAEFAGWNLVGNPFGVNAYIGNRDFYVMEAGSEIILADRVQEGAEYIKPMEGVFVIAANNDEELQFTTTPNGKSSRLGLNLSNGRNVIDRAMVRFDEGQQLPKFQLNRNSTKLYIPQDGKDFAVVCAEEMGAMPVNFKAEDNGTYNLNFSCENVEFSYLHLIDNKTGNDIDVLQTPNYSFEAKTTDYESRFKLVFATGDNSNDDTFAFYSNGSFVINNEGNAELQVIDVTGRIVKSESVNGCTNVNVNAAPGVYMLRLVNGDNVKVQKVVVR